MTSFLRSKFLNFEKLMGDVEFRFALNTKKLAFAPKNNLFPLAFNMFIHLSTTNFWFKNSTKSRKSALNLLYYKNIKSELLKCYRK